jgi:hypothetical protein
VHSINDETAAKFSAIKSGERGGQTIGSGIIEIISFR